MLIQFFAQIQIFDTYCFLKVFSCDILFYLNMIEDDNLIGTLSEIEKHCETSQGIVSKANVYVN